MAEELLRLEDITRRITSEFYIRNVDLTIYKGEVLALAGKNAAGKSTLAAVLNGALPADSGRILLDGAEIAIRSPEDAKKYGIITLMQNNSGFPDMSVADNVLFGTSYYKSGSIGSKKLLNVCLDCFRELGADINPAARFGSLTPAQKQIAGLARARLTDARLIIMDEPSSHLPERECEILGNVVRALRNSGVSVLYITHRLKEILQYCDRVAFVQRGELREVRPVAGMTELDLVEAIEGYRVESIYGKREGALGAPLLEAGALLPRCAAVPVSFALREGELVAVLGGADAWTRGVCRALCGLEPYGGELRVRGETVRLKSPLEADAARIVCAIDEETEDAIRHYDSKGGKRGGALYRLAGSVREATENLGKAFSGVTGVNRLKQSEYMTGGYRQKELMLRAMARDGDIYVLADPSNGVDLQTRMSIYSDIRRAQERGKGVVCFTEDVEEALGLADTVVVLRPDGTCHALSATETSLAELKNMLNM